MNGFDDYNQTVEEAMAEQALEESTVKEMANSVDRASDQFGGVDDTALALQKAIKQQTRQPAPTSAIPDNIKQYLTKKASVNPMAEPISEASRAPAVVPNEIVAEAIVEAPKQSSLFDSMISPDHSKSEANLKEAQRKRDFNEAMAGFTGAGKLALANSVPGFKLTMDDYKAELEQAGRPVDSVNEQQNLKKSNSDLDSSTMNRAKGSQDLKKGEFDLTSQEDLVNPNSEASILARQLASEFLKKPVPQTFSAAQLDKLMPGLKLKADLDFKREDSRQKALDRLNLEKIAAASKADKKNDEASIGQKTVDKKYAEDYNAFTGGGEVKAVDAIQKLNGLRKIMAKDNGIIQSGGGSIAGSLPDFTRSQKSIAQRDNIRTTANAALKATFGGQLSDGEREALANEFYNDKLDNEENLKIIDQKVKELKNGLAIQRAKAKHFRENKATLDGFKAPSNESSISSKVRVSNGKETLEIDESDLADAMADGYKRI